MTNPNNVLLDTKLSLLEFGQGLKLAAYVDKILLYLLNL
jgi:hypothetical protein